MKNGHSEDDTFHTTSKTGDFKRVIFIMKVLPFTLPHKKQKAKQKEQKHNPNS